MARFEKERKITDVLYSRIGIVVLLVIAVLLVLSVISVFSKRREARKEAKAAEARLADVTNRKAELSADIDRLTTPAGKEEALRDRYREAKPGEGLVVIVDKNEQDSSAEVSSSERVSFFQNLSQFFKNLFQ